VVQEPEQQQPEPVRELPPEPLQREPERREQPPEPLNSQAQPQEEPLYHRYSRCLVLAQPQERVQASNSCIRPTLWSP
jgi:hypothetical protein